MKVTDIFSWVPAKELALEQLEQIFINGKNDEYEVSTDCKGASVEALACQRELASEGKKVAYILKDENLIAVIGYK